MIEVRDLVYEYPTKRALDGVSLTVKPADDHGAGGTQWRGQDDLAALPGRA
jgi:energy-coupling factor transporter ATP-binding protein EcfA2